MIIIEKCSPSDSRNKSLIIFICLQSYGIKVGYGGIPGPSGGRDGPSAAGGGCCS